MNGIDEDDLDVLLQKSLLDLGYALYLAKTIVLLDAPLEDSLGLEVQSFKYLIKKFAAGDQVLELLVEEQRIHVFKLPDCVEVAEVVKRRELLRQGGQARGNLAHDDFYEVALVDQVADELGIDAQRVEAHDDDVIQEVLLALREHTLSVFEVVHQDVKGKAHVVGHDVVHGVLVADRARSSCAECWRIDQSASSDRRNILLLVLP